jgi:peptidoglycan-associated lipoprotein
MRRIALGLGLGVVVAVLSGCPPTYPKCQSDEQCKDHKEVCVQGACQQCATDAHCQTGFVCQQQKCVPKPECTTDTQCSGGKKCQTGKCTLPQGACSQDSDCANGGKCKNNACLEKGACTEESDCGMGEGCVANKCAPKAEAQASCDWTPVRFEFNDYSLTSAAQQQLSALADCLKNQKATLTLAGHADERGTEEYNLQLSNRRAESVKKYLADLGISATKLKVVGYGETRPVNNAQTEEGWAENRRVEFEGHP